jgi:protein-S-isoprenylcysteine O-methyltransferase Ste14
MVAIRNLIVVKKIIPNPINYAGITLIIAGIFIAIIVRKGFEKIDTEIHTFKNPRKLVTNGLFKFSRNPIYLGFTISLIGVWILLGTILPIIGLLLFIIVINNYYIPYEEQIMKKVFGNEYEKYKSKVRRWL